jgi:opacity protein-like surface antigen
VFFTNNVRVSIPTSSTRLQPYFVAGGGIASIRRTADFVYTFPVLTPAPLPPGINIPTLPVSTFSDHVTSSSVDLALTLGGGLDVRVASQLSIEADLRLFRLMGDTDRNVGRFGVGVRYRF